MRQAEENQENVSLLGDATNAEAPVAATPLSKKDMLAQWKRTQALETPKTKGGQQPLHDGLASIQRGAGREPLAQRDLNASLEQLLSSQQKVGKSSKLAWVEKSNAENDLPQFATPSRSKQMNGGASGHGPGLVDLKARVDVMRRESVLRDVRRESISGLSSLIPATPNRNLAAMNASAGVGALGDLNMSFPSCLSAAMFCFDEESFLKDCNVALKAKVRSSRANP